MFWDLNGRIYRPKDRDFSLRPSHFHKMLITSDKIQSTYLACI